ncbi:OadG family protein [Cycloclasticus pugetii]|nr:OadG family transporter subunit [Cycloclasticus pugetii]
MQLMNITNLLEQGVELMLLGMGMVFFILGMLVFAIKGVSAVIQRYEPVVEHSSKSSVSTDISEDIVTAITIAVQRFRSK